MVGLDLNTIRHALDIARKKGCREVWLRASGVEFHAVLSAKSAAKAKRLAEAQEVQVPDAEVPAPCVGYFKPLAKPVHVGQEVKAGDLLGQVMALGLPNDIESTVSGEVTEVLVKDGDPVQFGQAVFKIKVAE